jgi:hypothetical protein
MMEAIAFGAICFILAPKGSPLAQRLKKGAGGAILFVALFQSYSVLQPLLPSEIDHLLHSTIWGVLFAYAVPNPQNRTKVENKEEQGDADEKNDERREVKVGTEEGKPPTFTLI